jgi:hypothetical protein
MFRFALLAPHAMLLITLPLFGNSRLGAVTNGERAAYDAPIFNRKVTLFVFPGGHQRPGG